VGSDWRSHLISPPESTQNPNIIENPTSLVRKFSYIPIPRDYDSEAQHCLRMKRCGGLWAENVGGWLGPQMPPEGPLQAAEKQIFGWPSVITIFPRSSPPSVLL